MDDLISRQSAIDAHCELCVYSHRCNCDICPDVEVFKLLPSAQPDIARSIATIIENEKDMRVILASKPSAQQWIPCSERLPEEYAQYLICYEDGECFVYWLEDADWARGVIEKEHIVAWMPLPKPYKGEES